MYAIKTNFPLFKSNKNINKLLKSVYMLNEYYFSFDLKKKSQPQS